MRGCGGVWEDPAGGAHPFARIGCRQHAGGEGTGGGTTSGIVGGAAVAGGFDGGRWRSEGISGS
jgi:hypothetical protein